MPVIATARRAALAAALSMLLMTSGCGPPEPTQAGDPESERAFLDDMAERAAHDMDSPVAGDQRPVKEVSPGAELPKIEVETQRLEMGVISNDEITTEQIRIHNHGEGILHVTDLHTTCGCTMPTMEERFVEPGEYELLDIAVDPFRINGFYSNKTVTVVCNDPDQAHTDIEVIAEIEKEFELEPASFDFGTVTRGESPKMTAVLRQLDAERVEVLELAPRQGADFLDLGFSRLPQEQWREPGKAEYLVRVGLNAARIPNGDFGAALSIVTSCKRVPRFMVQITGTMDSFYTIEPNPLRMGIVRRNEDGEAQLTVRSERPFTIENLTVDGEHLTVSSDEEGQGISQTVDVALDMSAEESVVRGAINFDVVAGGTAYPASVPYHAVLMRGGRPAAAPRR